MAIRRSRTERDVQSLTGRRGPSEKRAVLWDEFETLTTKIAAKLAGTTFGAAVTPYLNGVASLDEDALEAYLGSANTINLIEQDIVNNNTYIQNEATRLDEADAAIASDVSALTTRVGAAESAITTEQTTRADADTALASDISTVSADLDAAEASVTQNAAAIATIENHQAATYTMRLVAGSAISEFEMVAADNPIDGPASAIRMKADNILLDGTVRTPHLKAGAVAADKIAANAVTATKIAAGAVTAGKIAANSVAADRVDVTSFSAAGLSVFGDTLQSSDYDPGLAGWRITKAGDAEFNSLVVREGNIEDGAVSSKVSASTSGTVYVYSNNSTYVCTVSLGESLGGTDLWFVGWGGELKEGSTYGCAADVQIRYQSNGIWGDWITLGTYTRGSATWQGFNHGLVLNGTYTNVQFRFWLRMYGSGMPSFSGGIARNLVVTAQKVTK